jgi:hypothetical protein
MAPTSDVWKQKDWVSSASDELIVVSHAWNYTGETGSPMFAKDLLKNYQVLKGLISCIDCMEALYVCFFLQLIKGGSDWQSTIPATTTTDGSTQTSKPG